MKLTYIGPHDEVTVGATGLTCKRGESVEVPDAVAGRAPKPDKDDPDKDDPGEGLLAQTTNWQTAAAKASKKADS